MKTTSKMIVLPLLASLAIGTGAVWAASDTTASVVLPQGKEIHGKHDMHRHGMRRPSPFMASLHQLNLSDAQHKSVESLLDGLKQQREANIATERNNLEALGNPGDKDYATAVQTAKTLAATSIQRRADVETQIYNLLTAEQKAKLPQVLAELKAKQGERRGAWQDHHHDDKSAS
jgi:Spy/CpxP family protein refolding chaperone